MLRESTAFVATWRSARPGFAEQVLQLILLDESLTQLAALAAQDDAG